MITRLMLANSKLNSRLKSIKSRLRRAHFICSCRTQHVKLDIGKNVRFHHPIRVYGVGGTIQIADGVSFAWDGGGKWLGPIGFEMHRANANVSIGRNAVIMRAVRFICFDNIAVGENATLGDGCLLLDSDVHNFTPGRWNRPVEGRRIVLGDCVHLAPDVTVLKGVTIGRNTMIGNRSVVQNNLPENSVALGNPARVFLTYACPAEAK